MFLTRGSPAGGSELKSKSNDVKLLEETNVLSAVSGIVGDCELSVVLWI